MESIAQRRYNMNRRSQMQGGKNWILPEEINANLFFWDSHWLEIWKINLCPSMGPNGGSVATDSWPAKRRFYYTRVVKTGFCLVRPMSCSATSTSSQSVSDMGRWISFKPVWNYFLPSSNNGMSYLPLDPESIATLPQFGPIVGQK